MSLNKPKWTPKSIAVFGRSVLIRSPTSTRNGASFRGVRISSRARQMMVKSISATGRAASSRATQTISTAWPSSTAISRQQMLPITTPRLHRPRPPSTARLDSRTHLTRRAADRASTAATTSTITPIRVRRIATPRTTASTRYRPRSIWTPASTRFLVPGEGWAERLPWVRRPMHL